jgi:uncharacterized protein
MFDLHCVTEDGHSVVLHYDPHSSRLLNHDGSPVIDGAASEAQTERTAVAPISPQAPGRKSAEPVVLKIQLGLTCNYSCSYCSQSSQIPFTTASKTADVHDFVAGLDSWLVGAPRRIEFWGGEPLLHFAKLRHLVPELDKRYPDSEFSMVTNGTLLTVEILDFIAEHDILITLSHDGPGQALRGKDPFDDPTGSELIRELWRERKARQRMSFNAVLTQDNSDPAIVRQWFADTLGDPDVVVSLEGVVAVHDADSRDASGYWTDAQYARMREAVAATFDSGAALRMPALLEKARDFIHSVTQARPSAALGQKCSMDREDHLAVDLKGNVLTCQNTGAKGQHGIGTVRDMADVRLDTSTHWAHRNSCGHCPVLQLCQGSCMFLHGDDFAKSCENEYHFNLGILDGILRRACKLKLVSVEGDIRRPRRYRSIAIQAQDAPVPLRA